METKFLDLDLRPQLVQTLTELGYSSPTPIQSAIIPAMLAGHDVIGQSQTGTGKTAAFALPILQNLLPGHKCVQSLVLTPTRELAMQVANAMGTYGRHPGARVLAVYGGQPYYHQLKQLKKGVDIVIGTPGRLLDLIQRKALDLSCVSTVVLDEADEMLSMGFIEDIEAILAKSAATRQTALFSATMPNRIRRLSSAYMREPQSFTMEHKQLTVETTEQRYYLINQKDKLAALTRLFETEPITTALIFARTRIGTAELVNELTTRGFAAEALNGDMSQEARERVMHRFRNNQIKVLVATDVASRGLDVDDISHVFNFDLPEDPEVYVHRVGRTGRAGKTGIAISLLTPAEQHRLRRIEAYTKQKMTSSVLPTAEDIQSQRDARMVEKLMVWLRRGRGQREREMVDGLVAEGQDLTAIAIAALKLVRAEEKQRPIEPISDVLQVRSKKKKRPVKQGNKRSDNSRTSKSLALEKGMVRIALSSGENDGLQVSHVVGTIAHFAKIPGRSLGKIQIQNKKTFVDVPEKLVGRVIANTGNYRIGKQFINVERV